MLLKILEFNKKLNEGFGIRGASEFLTDVLDEAIALVHADEGYLFLLDRRKDVIITGGENVYSVEVENVLLQHPAVAEVAVVGVSDPVYGQAVHAVVVLQPDADVDTAALQRFCRSHIGGFKIPRSIHYQRQLPRTAMGKVMKSALREQLQP